jgi:isoleucyl-tRNA synthetase
VEARVFKDVFPRYRTMKGMSVRRKAGWDCHGLPVELEVEKELGLDSKADIEAYGIEAFNEQCRESVLRYVGAFEDLSDRIGFWIDNDDAYRTMDRAVRGQPVVGPEAALGPGPDLRGLPRHPVLRSLRHGLSDAEVAQGYQTIDDPSVYVRFPVTDGPLADERAALVVWTTTPWTLPSNTACAVGADIAYELVRTSAFGVEDELLIIAADLRTEVLGRGRPCGATGCGRRTRRSALLPAVRLRRDARGRGATHTGSSPPTSSRRPMAPGSCTWRRPSAPMT